MAIEPEQMSFLNDEAHKHEHVAAKLREKVKAKIEPPNLGKSIKSRVPDFNDPDRPLTCLEVNFPIVPVNRLARQEGNAGKPIYQMSKWWARRRSSVFRTMLLAAATQAPVNEDPTAAVKQIWDNYYANHQAAKSFSHLRVLDPFMGGGTTLVEGARLGMHMYGMDLNPVAWFVVKNELAGSDPEQVQAFFHHIEAEVKPQIQPFYTTDCPRGHKGHWIDSRTGEIASVKPLDMSPQERLSYRWAGPEVVYTFWAKHSPCLGGGCGHRTPIFKSLIIAEKKLTTNYLPMHCNACQLDFDAELGSTRIAPDATYVQLPNEKKFTETSQEFARYISNYDKGSQVERDSRLKSLLALIPVETALCCPRCGEFAAQDLLETVRKHAKPGVKASQVKKKDVGLQRKNVYMHLLLHPDWLKGSPSTINGVALGGFVGADPEASALWYQTRLDALSLIEIRGRIKSGEANSQEHNIGIDKSEKEAIILDEGSTAEDDNLGQNGLPSEIILPDGTNVSINAGTVPAQSTCTCMACGRSNDLLSAVKASGQTAAIMTYTLQCYCPDCEIEGYNYGGRFFKTPDVNDLAQMVAADAEWTIRSLQDLTAFWPREPLPYAHMTHHLNGGIPNWGYTHWWTMFNPRQLLTHASLLRTITIADPVIWPLDVREQALGAFQQYLRNQNMFCFWDISRDCMAPSLSNANFHPKSLIIENCVFHELGRGNWTSSSDKVTEGAVWQRNPWESFLQSDTSKTEKFLLGDGIDSMDEEHFQLHCDSSTELPLNDGEVDLVVTDPPFGDNVFYADLSDFFYVWLRIPMLQWYKGQPEETYFRLPATPKALEAITNRAEHPDIRSKDEKRDGGRTPADEFYQQTLTTCWAEACRVLKPGGLMAFTFHHSADEPWVNVLESLFEAGFILVATYPIRSDESKGDNAQFGSKKIEYDIIHVCRKRLDDSDIVSWARMRDWVYNEVTNLRRMLELHQKEELSEADIRVILRGKALEYYSRHYGRVMTGSHELLSIRDALVGINLLIDEITTGEDTRLPDTADPITRLFLSIFAERPTLPRDELHKMLRGNTVDSAEFIRRGWLMEGPGKTVIVTSLLERFKALRKPGRRRDTIKHDLDQAHFFIGAAFSDSGIDITRTLNELHIPLHDDLEALLAWYTVNDKDESVRNAAALAQRMITTWRLEKKEKPEIRQVNLFD